MIAKTDHEHNIHYLNLLAKQYPTIQKASTEIINLKAILGLPKGTEHFMSDIHGEYETFTHILNSGSGIIRGRINDLFRDALRESEKNELATLIYYPEEKLKFIVQQEEDIDEWFKLTLHRLTKVCRSVTTKYTRSKVRKALPKDFAYVIEELLHEVENDPNKQGYYDGILEAIISTGRAKAFIVEISILIRKMAVDQLHIVGDIFDRGPNPELIMDKLMEYQNIDIQWGNHDIVWMGAALGSKVLIATLIRIAARYDNLNAIEDGYGINLMPLGSLAMHTYADDPCHSFSLKLSGEREYSEADALLVKRMQKAIAIIQFKLEGQLIQENPELKMNDRLLLEHIDYEKGTIKIGRKTYTLNDQLFPTIDPHDPYALSAEEQEVIERLQKSFLRSHKLQTHLKFLIDKGSMYLSCNSNLLFHGCVPMTQEGEFQRVKIEGKYYAGEALMQKFDDVMQKCFLKHEKGSLTDKDLVYVYYLWTGPDSPLFGKSKMATFERYFIDDAETHVEDKNGYFTLRSDKALSIRVLEEFGLDPDVSHIINGHVPVKSGKGENPLKGDGKMIVIDGGMAKAYQPVTGIAGYTLISNSYGLLLAAHEPFESQQVAIEKEKDIVTELRILEKSEARKLVGDTDVGKLIQHEVEELEMLLDAYRKGLVKQRL